MVAGSYVKLSTWKRGPLICQICFIIKTLHKLMKHKNSIQILYVSFYNVP